MGRRGTVSIHFSLGLGNNIFQYVFGRLIAELHNMKLRHPAIPEFGIEARKNRPFTGYPTKTIKVKLKIPDTQYHKFLDRAPNKKNYYLYGFFEDYTLYKPHLERIRSWFPQVEKTNTNDLVLHMRLGNRLVQRKSLMSQVSPRQYANVIKSFDFDKLYIVTDTSKSYWRPLTKDDVNMMKRQRRKKYKNNAVMAPIEHTMKYMDDLVSTLSQFEPIIVHHKDHMKDFNFIRSFDKMIIHNSTFSWWAATLSHASRVGVYKPWKPAKGKKNKNLGRTDFPGWFGWGTDDRANYWK